MTDLEFVVSRGSEGAKIKIENYTGLGYNDAVQKLAQKNIPFYFSMRGAAGNEKPGIVVKQTPSPGIDAPVGSIVQLEMTQPEGLAKGTLAGLFEYTLPDYFVTIDMKLEAVTPSGERRTLFSMSIPAVLFQFPTSNH